MSGKSPVRSKLLLNLNTDMLFVEDLVRFLYGEIDKYTIEKTKSAVRNTAKIGWDIFAETNMRTMEKGYVLSEEHYDLIDANRKIVRNWNKTSHKTMSPEAVMRAAEKNT